ERCRTAALGGHVERCEACAHLRISYNSLYGDLYVKLSVGTTRGEPAHWARSIAPRPCIRLDPCWTRTMKQSFASTARLRGGGPFCRRHRSHGVVRVTATSACMGICMSSSLWERPEGSPPIGREASRRDLVF